MHNKTDLFKMFKSERDITNRIKIEVFLLQAIKFRDLGILTVPVELPDGSELGAIIDKNYNERLDKDSNSLWRKLAGNLFAKKEVARKQSLIREEYDKVIQESDTYKAHIEWARALKLVGFEYEVRPSVKELFFYNDAHTAQVLQDLMQLRLRIKEEAVKKFSEDTPIQFILYPEEHAPHYIEHMGRVLGYPDCCIEAYLTDRSKGDSVEVRSAVDLHAALKDKNEIEPWAYFVKGFVPCSPTCKAATELGKQAHKQLGDIHPEIADAYYQLLDDNVAKLKEYAVSLKERLREQAREQNIS